MLQTKIYKTEESITSEEKQKTVDFLYTHLDEFGDSKEDIGKSINFALNIVDKDANIIPLGGFVLNGIMDDKIVCSVIINKTGMSGYIPENILVYIATHRDYRGKGIGKQMMKEALEATEGNVKLHVEPENPARFLYEKIGFTSKYLEMRYNKK
ncbi:MAG: GNAT family N-acetyltransferase [Bacteroidales bacterium]|nr:GNAT family N-acetyltransferase [Bacteroidales bacterium]